jgi:hypothetical protein
VQLKKFTIKPAFWYNTKPIVTWHLRLETRLEQRWRRRFQSRKDIQRSRVQNKPVLSWPVSSEVRFTVRYGPVLPWPVSSQSQINWIWSCWSQRSKSAPSHHAGRSVHPSTPWNHKTEYKSLVGPGNLFIRLIHLKRYVEIHDLHPRCCYADVRRRLPFFDSASSHHRIGTYYQRHIGTYYQRHIGYSG